MSAEGWILAPCPFCAGPPCMTEHSDERILYPKDSSALVASDDGTPVQVRVWCHECGARGPNVDSVVYDVEELHNLQGEAARLWNGRDYRHLSLYGCRRYLPFPGGWEDLHADGTVIGSYQP